MSLVDHSSKLSEIYGNLYLNSKNSDATLVVKNKNFPVHRLILATQSDFFQKLFYVNYFAEGKQKSLTIDAPVEAFELVLKYFYTGTLNLNQSEESVLEVLELSRRYGLSDLEASLEDQAVFIMSLDNLEQIIKAGSIMRSEKMIRKCCDVINEHSDKFFASYVFLRLTVDEVITLLYHDSLTVAEIDKFKAIAAWLNEHPECPSASKEALLKYIDVTHFSKHQLATIVVPAKVYDSEVLLEVLAQQIAKDPSPTPESKATSENQYKTIGQLSSDTDFIKSNTQQEIVIDLGSKQIFNYMEFDLGSKASYDITLHTANDDLKWSYLRAYRNRTSVQWIYLPEITARFVRITGLEGLNRFKVMRLSQYPKYVDERVRNLRENKINPKTVVMSNPKTLQYAALCWDYIDQGKRTSFSHSDLKGNRHYLKISLNSAYSFSQCRFRLWEDDGRSTYSFNLYSLHYGTNSQLLRTFIKVNGWQIVDLEPGQHSGFGFESSQEIRLVHFEAS